jgi:hypothetical protein
MRVDDVRDAIKGLDERMDRRFESVDRRFDSLDRKLDSHFKWLVGVVVAAFGTVASLILATDKSPPRSSPQQVAGGLPLEWDVKR